jgi:hypothetical protein
MMQDNLLVNSRQTSMAILTLTLLMHEQELQNLLELDMGI